MNEKILPFNPENQNETRPLAQKREHGWQFDKTLNKWIRSYRVVEIGSARDNPFKAQSLDWMAFISQKTIPACFQKKTE